MVLGLLVVTLVLAGQMVDIDPEIISRIEQGDLDALQLIDPQVMENAVLAMAMGAAISGSITYFAVPLIWFSKQGMGSALMMGLKGLGRNWKPLLVIGLLLGLLAVPMVLLFGSFYLSALSGARIYLAGFSVDCLARCFNYCCLAPSTWHSGIYSVWMKLPPTVKQD